MLRALNPTSKTALKNQCLLISQGDLQKAKELYDFYIDGIEDIPATDPIPPTWQQNTMNTVNGIMAWLQNNSGTIVDGVNYIRSLMGRAAVQAAEETVEEVAIEAS